VFDWIPSYEENLALSQTDLVEMREAYAAANPGFQTDARALDGYVGDVALMTVGQELFVANCAACHGQQGEGLIGPNLTDAYAIHGNEPEDIFRVITEGVLDKGMTPWGNVLTAEERAGVMAYVKSLEGTNIPGGKEPQGERVN
ncbi:MAG: cytochrome c, partial [Bacteroidota bacterium]